MSAARREPWPDAAVVAAGCLLGWFAFLGPTFSGPTDMPGDLGDARFNLYVLEHVFRWLTGSEPSLFSPGLFWPYPSILGFSDTHFGTAGVYALSRAAGLDPYDAFKVWFALGHLASFVAAYHVMRKLGLRPLVAGPLAFAFGFSLPVIVQMGHPQLLWRVAVPYCFWFTLRYAERGTPADLFGFLVALSVQTLINVYLGVFSFVLCAFLFAGVFVGTDGLAPRAWWRRIAAMGAALRRPTGRDLTWGAAALVAVAATGALLAFHAGVARLYGIRRPWEEIASMIPRPQSYLLLDNVPYWEPVSRMLGDVPMRGEQQMFLGIPVTALAVAGLVTVLLGWRHSTPRVRAFAVCILATLAVYMAVGPYSLYWLVAQVPGFNSIRAVSRVSVVLAFPVTAFVGLFLADLAVRRAAPWIATAAALVVAAWMTFDLAAFQRLEFSTADLQARVARLVERAGAAGDRPIAFASDPDSHWVLHAIDSMLAAQELGLPTLNGYSGYMPRGTALAMTCVDAQVMLDAYKSWARKHGAPGLAKLPVPVLVGGADCDLSPAGVAATPGTIGPPLKAKDAPSIVLSDLALVPGAPPRLSVRITNNAKRTLHQFASQRFRLSWSTVPPPELRFENRIELDADIPPGTSRVLSWEVPPDTRIEDVSVQFVVEGRFWAHDLGIPPLRAGP